MMKNKYFSLIIICSLSLSFGQLEWYPTGLQNDTINTILLTSKSVLMAGTRYGLFYRIGTTDRWGKFNIPKDFVVTSIIEINPEMVAVAYGIRGNKSDGIHIGKYSATGDTSYIFTHVTWFETPQALASKGTSGDTLFVGRGKDIAMIFPDSAGGYPKKVAMKLPEFAFGVEKPFCASLLCFPASTKTPSLYAGGYDKGVLPGKGHLLQLVNDSMVVIKDWNVSAMTQGAFAPVGPVELVVGTRDSGLYSTTAGINPVEWTHWKSPKDRPVTALDAAEGPMQGDQLMIAVDSGVFTGRDGNWQEIGDISAEPLCLTGSINLGNGFAGTVNGVYQCSMPSSIDNSATTGTDAQIFSHYRIDNSLLRATFNLPEEGRVKIVLYTLSGRKLCTVFEGLLKKGKGDVTGRINASNNSVPGKGMYLIRVYYNGMCIDRPVVNIIHLK